MNKLDIDYQNLLKDILENGIKKKTRNGEVLSVFGREIRHKMSDGFPLLTTKKMAFKQIVVELLWFLRGDTNIKYLVDNNCNIWNGDAYESYKKQFSGYEDVPSQEWFINEIKTDDEFARKFGDMGKIYGYQWRKWTGFEVKMTKEEIPFGYRTKHIDQISELLKEIKSNPDSRRLIVSAWNPAEIEYMKLPPCHYGFQIYTRELNLEERINLAKKVKNFDILDLPIGDIVNEENHHEAIDSYGVPRRAISLKWNEIYSDFLNDGFKNIASYGLLLCIFGKILNMMPDELIGSLGDTHIYSNQIEGVKEQLGKDLSLDERVDYWFHNNKPNRDVVDHFDTLTDSEKEKYLNNSKVPTKTREPYKLPSLMINTEFWLTITQECGVGEFSEDFESLVNSFEIDDFKLKINYE